LKENELIVRLSSISSPVLQMLALSGLDLPFFFSQQASQFATKPNVSSEANNNGNAKLPRYTNIYKESEHLESCNCLPDSQNDP
jgi:hypothetical protein